ncbi:MAG: hypothetical protein MUF43_07890 [Flavobacterium sp.]|jgi:hypothetical protein|nr:hypothetical protein [Flavobacterium sp.]
MSSTKKLTLIFIIVCGNLLSFKFANSGKCKHRKIPYFTPNYSEYKKEYASFFDSIATNRFNECICGKMPQTFNSQIKYDKYTSVLIEPLFINFQDCNGIYSQRAFGRLSPLYSNGKYPHYLFAVIDTEFIDMTDLDSLKIKNILTKRNEISKLYSSAELDSIFELVKHGQIWTIASELAPYYVKDNGKLIYNAWDEK